MKRLLFACFFSALLVAPLFAQQASPKCDGTPAIVRLSEITPTGSMDGFMKAMDAHIAWYRNNGFKDNQIFAAKVLRIDEKTKAASYSDKQVMTYHLNPPEWDGSKIKNRGDAAWNAYVKQYQDNSNIKATYLVCMPKVSVK